jgi:hypothetical protein
MDAKSGGGDSREDSGSWPRLRISPIRNSKKYHRFLSLQPRLKVNCQERGPEADSPSCPSSPGISVVLPRLWPRNEIIDQELNPSKAQDDSSL